MDKNYPIVFNQDGGIRVTDIKNKTSISVFPPKDTHYLRTYYQCVKYLRRLEERNIT